MNLTDLRDKLASLDANIPFFHFVAPVKQPCPYGVWAESGQEDAQYADNRVSLQVLGGWLEYYTQTEYDPFVQVIQSALNDLFSVAWELERILYNETTRAISYEWSWRMTGKAGV